MLYAVALQHLMVLRVRNVVVPGGVLVMFIVVELHAVDAYIEHEPVVPHRGLVRSDRMRDHPLPVHPQFRMVLEQPHYPFVLQAVLGEWVVLIQGLVPGCESHLPFLYIDGRIHAVHFWEDIAFSIPQSVDRIGVYVLDMLVFHECHLFFTSDNPVCCGYINVNIFYKSSENVNN